MTFLDYLLGRNKQPEKPKALVYELADLKATSVERAAARQAKMEEQQRQWSEDQRKRGQEAAVEQFAQYRARILKQAEYDDDLKQYEINIAFHEHSKELDDYTEALADLLRDLFILEGVNAELVWEEHPIGEGSYYASDRIRYSAKLVVSW